VRRLCSVASALALVLVLASCSLLLPKVENPDGAAFTVVAATGTFTFAAGKLAADEPVIYIGGRDLATTDPDCREVGNGIGCWRTGFTLGAGEMWSVVVTGEDYSGNVTFYRPGSAEVHRAFLRAE